MVLPLAMRTWTIWHVRDVIELLCRAGIHGRVCRQVHLYNAYIAALCDAGEVDAALDVVDMMGARRVVPNVDTVVAVCNAVSGSARSRDIESVWARVSVVRRAVDAQQDVFAALTFGPRNAARRRVQLLGRPSGGAKHSHWTTPSSLRRWRVTLPTGCLRKPTLPGSRSNRRSAATVAVAQELVFAHRHSSSSM